MLGKVINSVLLSEPKSYIKKAHRQTPAQKIFSPPNSSTIWLQSSVYIPLWTSTTPYPYACCRSPICSSVQSLHIFIFSLVFKFRHLHEQIVSSHSRTCNSRNEALPTHTTSPSSNRIIYIFRASNLSSFAPLHHRSPLQADEDRTSSKDSRKDEGSASASKPQGSVSQSTSYNSKELPKKRWVGLTEQQLVVVPFWKWRLRCSWGLVDDDSWSRW